MKKCVVCIMIIALLFMTACGGSKYDDMSFDELFDLGTKYLQESNYSEAVLAFSAAIKIDEKSVDSYIGLADAYIGLDKTKKAIEVLEKGLELTDDFGIRMKLNALKAGSDDYGREMVTDNFIRAEELTIGGTPFYELTLDDVRKIFPNYEDRDPFSYDGYVYRVGVADNIQFEQEEGAESITMMSYNWWGLLGDEGSEKDVYHQPEFRNAKGCEDFDEVMSKLGFTEEGIEITKEACKRVDLDDKQYDIIETPLCRITGIDSRKDSGIKIEAYAYGYTFDADIKHYKVDIYLGDDELSSRMIDLFFNEDWKLESMTYHLSEKVY